MTSVRVWNLIPYAVLLCVTLEKPDNIYCPKLNKTTGNKFSGHYLDGVRVNLISTLKEYYEIVGKSRPLLAFFPTHADFYTEMHFYSWN